MVTIQKDTQFELLADKLLGEGAFGRVFLCRWHGNLAAAKLFNVSQTTESEDESEEIKMIRQLHNDYIIQFFGKAQYKGKLCLITSYAEKGSLFHALSRHTLTDKQKPHVITGLIKGMLYLKSKGVVHRDLKSLNVLLDSNYVPKICDFGLAKLKLNSSTHTKTASPVGSTRWMAPELFKVRPKYSYASDVYALGTVIWEVLTERLPYADTINSEAIINFIKGGEHEEIPDSFQEHYKSIIKECWQLEPQHRITAEEVNKVNEEALQLVDTAVGDHVSDIEIGSSVGEPDTPEDPEATDYSGILNEYLMKTDGDLGTRYHLALVLDRHGDGFIQWVKAAATHGNDDAAAILGEMYFHGCGVPQDYQAAIEQFSMVAEEERTSDNAVKHGSARAQNSLGWMYDYSRGVEENFEQAFNWYTKAAAQGSIAAKKNLEWLFANGQGVQQSDDKAFELFTEAAEQGNAAAKNGLGCMYRAGRGVSQSDDKAVEWYTKAAEQGHAGAQNILGEMYQEGRGVPQNDDKAVEWYTKAAEQGNHEAQYRLEKMYQNGRGVLQSDDKAADWYVKSTEQGYVDAQYALGCLYDYGRGIQQSNIKATAWYRTAADQGHAGAQNNLGQLYETGRGVPQSYVKAYIWYTKAAEQGYANAQNNLGQMYEHGRGVPHIDSKAFTWYTKAAEQGHAAAQFNLGRMYFNGRGVPQSDNKAVEWYTKAAEQGVWFAQTRLEWTCENGRGI